MNVTQFQRVEVRQGLDAVYEGREDGVHPVACNGNGQYAANEDT